MQAERGEPGRVHLVARFRRLFALFTVAVAAGVVLQIFDVAPDHRRLAVVAALGLAAWAAAMRQWADRSLLVDVVGFAPLTAAGLLFVTHLLLFPLLLAAAFQRGFHAAPRRAYSLAFASVLVWEYCRSQAGEVPRPGTTVALAVVLAGATAFARVVRRMAEDSDRAARRETRLLQSVRTLTGLRDPVQILQEVAHTGVDLAEIPGASAVVWQAVGDEFRAVASYGTKREIGVQLAVLPGQVLRVFEVGQPEVLDGAVARQLHHVGEQTPFYPAYVLVPLSRADGPRVGLLLYCPAVPDDDLLELLHRFAMEVGLAEERAGLLSKLATREARLSSIIDHSSDVIALLDEEGRFTLVNPSGEQRFGHRANDVLGRNVFDLVHPDDRESVNEAMRGSFADATTDARLDTVQIACRLRTVDGEWRDVESQLTVREEGGFVLNTRDVTDRKALEAEIVHRALHDPLTNLANRALFLDRLQHAVDRSGRTGVPVAVLMLDLDDFKPVNDTYGHAVGDAVLVEVARRLEGAVRLSDTAARLGGDEFAVLVEEVPDAADLVAFAERLHGRLGAPARIGTLELPISASLGAATSLPDESHEHLMRRADAALYSVKYSGKARVLVVDQDHPELFGDLPAGDIRDQRAPVVN